jgi:hypothetical protein
VKDPAPALDEELRSHLSPDGRRFQDPRLGIALSLPAADGWHWEPQRHGALLAMTGPEEEVKLWVSVRPVLADLPLAALGETLERSRSSLPGYREIGAGIRHRGGAEFYEIQYQNQDEHLTFRSLRRLYRRGADLISVGVLGLADRWADNEADTLQALDSLALQEPARD